MKKTLIKYLPLGILVLAVWLYAGYQAKIFASESQFILQDAYSDDNNAATVNSATSTPSGGTAGVFLATGNGTSTIGADGFNGSKGAGQSPYFTVGSASRVRTNIQVVASSSSSVVTYNWEQSQNAVDWFPYATVFSATSFRGERSMTATSTIQQIAITQTNNGGSTVSTTTISDILEPIGARYLRMNAKATGANSAIWVNLIPDIPVK